MQTTDSKKTNRQPIAGQGRNKLSAEEKRSKRIPIYLNAAEYLSINNKAIHSNISLTDYIRKMLLEGKVTNIENEEIQKTKMDLIKMGNNLNQITRLANGQGMLTDLPKLNELLENVYDLLKTYRR
jgi:Bacterial mobilisation protein (MobC)